MIYEYRCEDCGRRFEIWAKLAEKERGLEPVCPHCGSKKARQALGVFAIGGRSQGGKGPLPGPGFGCGPGCC